MKKPALVAISFLLFASLQPATATQPPTVSTPTDNPEMRTIFEADQAPRTDTGATVDWSVVGPQDEARRAQTRRLLASGALTTADDYHHASIIFQHGITADDFLLAHTLAMIASAKGHPDAPWTAAASLDRYLQAIGQPQIYGTQYRTPDRQSTTMEPYNRTLISDALRAALGVRSQAEQEARRQQIEARYRAALRPANQSFRPNLGPICVMAA